MISERLWHTRFGGDPAIVGKTIPLDGKPFTVIGVAPASFQILYESDLWTLYDAAAQSGAAAHALPAGARPPEARA